MPKRITPSLMDTITSGSSILDTLTTTSIAPYSAVER